MYLKHCNQVLWFNKEIVYNRKSLFLKHWYKGGIMYLEDVYQNNSFIDTAQLRDKIQNRYARANLIFDYSKLKSIIPKCLLNVLSKDNMKGKFEQCLSISILYNGKQHAITDFKNKQFYQMLEEAKDDVDPPAYWMNRINIEIHWKTVLNRNIVKIKENELKEFNFKILYNLLPVKRNLFLYGN